MALGVILAIGQKILGGVANTVKDYAVEKAKAENEKVIAIATEEQRTRQLELQKEIAEKGLEESVNALQTQQAITSQAQVEASESTYNSFVDNVSKQTQYNVDKLTDATNDYLARFRPDHTRKVFDTLILFANKGFLYYIIALIVYLLITVFAKQAISAEIKFTSLFIFPVPQNIFSAIIVYPMWLLYLIYEQWTYMQTYWFISRDEEKERFQKKKA